MNKKQVFSIFHLIPWIFLLGLLSITYARFFVTPYLGFNFSPSQLIGTVFVDDAPIEKGDKLIKFDHFELGEFYSPPRPAYLMDYSPGDEIKLLIEKPDGEIKTVNWAITGFTSEAFLDRFKGIRMVPYLFWVCGTITFLIVHPRDKHWALFSIYNYLIAILFSTGRNLTNYNIWFGSLSLYFCI